MHTYQNQPAPSNIDHLISLRRKAGQFAQRQFSQDQSIHSQDPVFRKRIESQLYHEPIIRITAGGVEFASRTLISPEYEHLLHKLGKAARAKRERQLRLDQRIEASQVKRLKPAEPALGNTGNNLEKFEKITREKRYRIQRFIQKNRLPGKRKCDCGKGHETVYECEECRRPGNTVCTCGSPIDDYVELKSNKEHGNITTSGVATCGSVWACPVCRAKIANERAKQLNQIYNEGQQKGWNFYMCTFTIPHTGSDNLAKLYGSSSLGVGLSGAFTKFRSSYMFSKKFKNKSYIGDIKAVEITWGHVNGFHPHLHFIVITKADLDVDQWEFTFLKEWQRQCINSGLEPPNERGVKIDKCVNVDQVEYLSKWSVGSELQSDQVKKSKGLNHSIAELEYMAIDEYQRSSGMHPISLDKICGVLRSYYKAMHGQKQLQYGNTQTGWKDEILKDDPDDIDLMEDLEENQEITHSDVCVLTKDLYQELRKKDLFSELVEALEHLEPDLPGFSELAYQKAKTVLFYMKIPDKGLLHPGETITG